MRSSEYVNLVRDYYDLVKSELDYCEQKIAQGDLDFVYKRIPVLISTVLTLGHFRGNEGIFTHSRLWPVDLKNDQRSELFKMSKDAEARLEQITQAVTRSGYKDAYLETLKRYFVAGYANGHVNLPRISDQYDETASRPIG